jgi:hypothetical protein
MKTGRRRKKEPVQEPAEQAPPSAPEEITPSKTAQSGAKKPVAARPPLRAPARLGRPHLPLGRPWLLILIALVAFVCLILLLSRACRGPGAPSTTYLPTTADGSWTTVVRLVVPQGEVRGGWRSDCEADPLCTVVPGTCDVRERADRTSERQVDDYDEYAYNIYYEETEGRLYEAVADSFVVTELNAQKDWWDGDRHYFSEEWLDTETCQYTGYTVWITDPEDKEYESEVVLSECEVWDHVVVMERVAEQDEYCQTENLGAMAVQDTLTQQGLGATVEWPRAVPPADGQLEREFEGTVTFRADGTQHTVKVTDVDTYIRYLTVPQYLGVDEEGDVVDLTDKAP